MEARDLSMVLGQSMEALGQSMEVLDPSTEALDLCMEPQVQSMGVPDLCMEVQFMVQVCDLIVCKTCRLTVYSDLRPGQVSPRLQPLQLLPRAGRGGGDLGPLQDPAQPPQLP